MSMLLVTSLLLAGAPAIAIETAAPAADADGGAGFDRLEGSAWSAEFEDGRAVGTRAPDSTRAALDALAAASRPDAAPVDLLRAVARLVERAWGAEPGLVAADAEDAPTFAWPAGDLDGDGLGDVLGFEVARGSGNLTLRAFRGTDGVALWSRALGAVGGALLLPPAGDLTGDGRADAILVTLRLASGEGTNACAPPAGTCLFAGAAGFAWDVSLLSGSDGAPRWTRAYEGAGADAARFMWLQDPAAYGATSGYAAARAAVVPSVVADRDGDGLRDLLVVERTLVFLYHGNGFALPARTAYAGDGAGGYLVETSAEIVLAGSGAGVPLRASARLYGASDVVEAGDAVGDATPDFLSWTLSFAAPPAAACAGRDPDAPTCAPPALGVEGWYLSIEMVDGRTLAPAWATARRLASPFDDAVVVPLRADATGDGRADFYVREMESWSLTPPRLALASGADGAPAWSASAFHAFPVGAIDASAGEDVVLVTHEVREAGVQATVSRVDGATGALLFATSRFVAPPEGFGSVTVDVRPLGRADGDAVRDVLFGTTMRSYPHSESTWSVESGATGDALYEATTPTLAIVYAAGDLDGDGLDDAYHLSADTTWRGGTFTLRAVLVATGATAWARDDAVQGFAPGAIVAAGGDLSGAHGADVVYGLKAGFGDGMVANVRVLEGATGAVLWSRGAA